MLTFKRCEEDYRQRVYDTFEQAEKVFARLESYIGYMNIKRYGCTPVEYISVDSVISDHGNYDPIDYDLLYNDKF